MSLVTKVDQVASSMISELDQGRIPSQALFGSWDSLLSGAQLKRARATLKRAETAFLEGTETDVAIHLHDLRSDLLLARLIVRFIDIPNRTQHFKHP
jgi:hypothetical protein